MLFAQTLLVILILIATEKEKTWHEPHRMHSTTLEANETQREAHRAPSHEEKSAEVKTSLRKQSVLTRFSFREPLSFLRGKSALKCQNTDLFIYLEQNDISL